MDYTRYLNVVSLARRPSPIQDMVDLLFRSPASMISLHAGVPNSEMFPFKSAEFTLKDGTVLPFDEEATEAAFRDGPTFGLPHFRRQLKELQDLLHSPPSLQVKKGDDPDGGREICVTPGAQDAICRVMEMLINRGDNVIVDRPTYASTLAMLRPLGCNLLGVDGDHDGTLPASLRQVLSRWTPDDAKDPNSGVPRIIYTVPSGMNPTGASLTLARKKEIYQIAREYNLLILEDDPYYFLQYHEPRVPTFLSLDEDGRVIRFDSFSKVVASGLRVGFVTGPRPLVYRLMLHIQCSITFPPTLTQLLVSRLLDQLGLEGFVEHTRKIRDFYRERKDGILKSAERWLTGLAEWNEPTAGLFLWIKLKGVTDSKKLIMEKALEKEVMLIPGCAFMPDDEEPCPYVRASYSVASLRDMDTAMQRLAALVREASHSSSTSVAKRSAPVKSNL